MAIFGKDKLLEIQEREKRENKHIVMLVDDEEGNLTVLSSIFEEKYDLVLVRDGREALEYLEGMENPEEVSLIISDQRMPNLTGTQLFERLIPIIPNTIRIILTGYTDISAIIDSVNKAKIYKFIIKPFDPNDVLLTVERALEAYDLQRRLDRYYRTLEQKVDERTRELREINNQITSSIRYAQTIQATILPNIGEMFRAFPEHFVIFKPKDIVSGDFYWFHAAEDTIFFASVDCTGHGVPGAFMSMIGYILLNKIIVEHEVEDPALILERLHLEVRGAMRQAEGKGAIDGMDIGLCRIHKGPRRIVFAGAKHSLYWVKQGNNGTELTAVKGDRKSIGGRQSEKKRTFTNHKLDLTAGDMIYLATDGFVDQSDTNEKKYGSKRLKVFLEKVAHHKTQDQKELLIKELADHQGPEEQRDDITVIGVRL